MTNDAATCDNTSLLNEYIRYKKHDWRRQETVRVRRSQLDQISEAIPDLVTASDDALHHWYERLNGSTETIAQYVTVITGLYTWMSSVRKARPDNPAQLLRRPRIPTRPPRPMLEKHYQLALACALSDPEMYMWLGLMGCSGLRCCEIAWARTHEIEEHPDGHGIARITGKGGKVRAIPIGSTVMYTLRPFLLGPGHIFTRPDGRPWTPKRVSDRTNTFLRGIGIHETGHALRHRFGTDYHALDPDLLRQAKIMGHASVDTTQMYTEVDPLDAAKYVEQLTRRRIGGRAA